MMIYHTSDIIKIEREQDRTAPPIGYDVTLDLMRNYKNNPAGLACAALQIGFDIGRRSSGSETQLCSMERGRPEEK